MASLDTNAPPCRGFLNSDGVMSGFSADRPSTWRSYKPSLCESCVAHCCRLPLEVSLSDLIRLGFISEEEAASSGMSKIGKRLKKLKIISSYTPSRQLLLVERTPGGDCIFLDSKTRQCKHYKDRPEVCRSFPVKVGTRIGYCPYEDKTKKQTKEADF